MVVCLSVCERKSWREKTERDKPTFHIWQQWIQTTDWKQRCPRPVSDPLTCPVRTGTHLKKNNIIFRLKDCKHLQFYQIKMIFSHVTVGLFSKCHFNTYYAPKHAAAFTFPRPTTAPVGLRIWYWAWTHALDSQHTQTHTRTNCGCSIKIKRWIHTVSLPI